MRGAVILASICAGLLLLLVYARAPTAQRANDRIAEDNLAIADGAVDGFLGEWTGDLRVRRDLSLPLILRLSQSNERFDILLDSPDQGMFALEGDLIEIDGTFIGVAFTAIGASLRLQLDENILAGDYIQGGVYDLELTRAG
ncbi:MAG: hypothetical protein AAFQ84_07960 [Pseudomonadota bacterium]